MKALRYIHLFILPLFFFAIWVCPLSLSAQVPEVTGHSCENCEDSDNNSTTNSKTQQDDSNRKHRLELDRKQRDDVKNRKQEEFDDEKKDALKSVKGISSDSDDLNIKDDDTGESGSKTKGSENKKPSPVPRVGAVAGITGEVYFVTKSGKKVKATSEIPVELGTRIITGPNSRIQIMLLDETVFTLGQNGDMVIDEFVYDPVNSYDKFLARVTYGILGFVTGKVTRDRRERIILPVGTIGIRGTNFELLVEKNGSGYLKLFSGKLEIKKKKPAGKFSLNSGEMVRFFANGRWGVPEPLDESNSFSLK